MKNKDTQRKKPLLQKWAEYKITKYLELDINGFSKNTAILLSFIVGVVATIPIVYFDYYISAMYPASFFENNSEFIIKLAYNGLVILLFSAIEIYLLYLITFRLFINLYKKYELSNLILFDYSISYSFYSVMAKIALESDEEPLELLKIDLDKNKHITNLSKLVYKSKIVVSNMVAKAILRKVILNNGLREGINYIAAPITGLWDALVLYFIINKMEFILKSTNTVNHFFIQKKDTLAKMSDDFFELSIRLLAQAIYQTKNYHPNYKYLLVKLKNEDYFTLDLSLLENIKQEDILENKIKNLSHYEKNELLVYIDLLEKISFKNKLNFNVYKEVLK